MRRRAFLAVGTTVACTLSIPAHAQANTYPNRPIRLIQGYAAGGNADTIARVISVELAKTLGQPVVVEALTGAGGTIAAGTVARAQPDGYTLLLSTGGHTVSGAIYSSLSYRTVDDFQMVSNVTDFPFLFVVPANSPYQNLGELLAAAKRDPEAISYGTAGVGTTHHLAGELLLKQAGVNLMHVPYRGDTASVTALMGGEIPLIIAPPTAVMANIRAGRMRALATSGAQRWQVMPEIPTVAESGVPGYDVASWAAVMAPAGTPRPIIDQLNQAVQAALQQPDVQARLADMGGVASGSTPEAMTEKVTSELQKWTTVVNDAGIPRQ